MGAIFWAQAATNQPLNELPNGPTGHDSEIISERPGRAAAKRGN